MQLKKHILIFPVLYIHTYGDYDLPLFQYPHHEQSGTTAVSKYHVKIDPRISVAGDELLYCTVLPAPPLPASLASRRRPASPCAAHENFELSNNRTGYYYCCTTVCSSLLFTLSTSIYNGSFLLLLYCSCARTLWGFGRTVAE